MAQAEYIPKRYRCRECGHEKDIATNHYQSVHSIASVNHCLVCPADEQTVWDYINNPLLIKNGKLVSRNKSKNVSLHPNKSTMIKSIIDAMCLNKKELAEALGFDRRSLYYKYDNPTWWTVGEVEKLAKELDLPVGKVCAIILGDKKVYQQTINQIIKKTNGKH